MKKSYKFYFLFVCVLISITLSGCGQDSIKFQRESKFQDMMNNVKTQTSHQSKVINSSGVIIYKTDTEQNQNVQNMNFGPKDLDFDLPVKFK